MDYRLNVKASQALPDSNFSLALQKLDEQFQSYNDHSKPFLRFRFLEQLF